MIHTKSPSHQSELRKSIKKLVTDLYLSTNDRNDQLADNEESIASYVCKLNDQELNRSFLDYCIAVKHYERSKLKG